MHHQGFSLSFRSHFDRPKKSGKPKKVQKIFFSKISIFFENFKSNFTHHNKKSSKLGNGKIEYEILKNVLLIRYKLIKCHVFRICTIVYKDNNNSSKCISMNIKIFIESIMNHFRWTLCNYLFLYDSFN